MINIDSATSLDEEQVWGDMPWKNSTAISSPREKVHRAITVRESNSTKPSMEFDVLFRINIADKSIKLMEILQNNLLSGSHFDYSHMAVMQGVSKPTLKPFSQNMLDVLFQQAKREVFEDGLESEFSRNLFQMMDSYSSSFFKIFKIMISQDLISTTVLAEALRWLGHSDNPATHEARREILENMMFHISPTVRDGAILGLSYMEDSASLPVLRRALESESIDYLRQDIQNLIEDLQGAS